MFKIFCRTGRTGLCRFGSGRKFSEIDGISHSQRDYFVGFASVGSEKFYHFSRSSDFRGNGYLQSFCLFKRK